MSNVVKFCGLIAREAGTIKHFTDVINNRGDVSDATTINML